jgi:hypothetical protein
VVAFPRGGKVGTHLDRVNPFCGAKCLDGGLAEPSLPPGTLAVSPMPGWLSAATALVASFASVEYVEVASLVHHHLGEARGAHDRVDHERVPSRVRNMTRVIPLVKGDGHLRPSEPC